MECFALYCDHLNYKTRCVHQLSPTLPSLGFMLLMVSLREENAPSSVARFYCSFSCCNITTLQIKSMALMEPDSPVLSISELLAWNSRGKGQQSLCHVEMQSYVPKQHTLCVHKHNQSLPGDSLKLQFQETIFVFVPHSGLQHKRSEHR